MNGNTTKMVDLAIEYLFAEGGIYVPKHLPENPTALVMFVDPLAHESFGTPEDQERFMNAVVLRLELEHPGDFKADVVVNKGVVKGVCLTPINMWV